jgi:hypothetical protein
MNISLHIYSQILPEAFACSGVLMAGFSQYHQRDLFAHGTLANRLLRWMFGLIAFDGIDKTSSHPHK